MTKVSADHGPQDLPCKTQHTTRTILRGGNARAESSTLIITPIHKTLANVPSRSMITPHHTNTRLLFMQAYVHKPMHTWTTANLILNGQFVWVLQSMDLHTQPRVMGTPIKMEFPPRYKWNQPCTRSSSTANSQIPKCVQNQFGGWQRGWQVTHCDLAQ